MKSTFQQIGKSISALSLRGVLALIAVFGLALSPMTQAVSPPPDGGYANDNTAEGTNALFSLTTGFHNTANGFEALFENTTGFQNTANGFGALFHNRTGFQNTANGFEALFENTTGFHNTANGFEALLRTTTGNHNTANGDRALESNTTGNDNTTDGAHSLGANTTGSGNIALGFGAGANLTTGNDNIDIGNVGVAGETETIRIGAAGLQRRAFIIGIHGVAVNGPGVVVSASGQLGVLPSSARFKDGIKPMDKASEAIFALKPVTFHYKNEIDPNRNAQFGLVAEDVAKVNPSLVTHDDKGEVYTVRYDAVNAMLLNEFLKARRQIDVQQKQIEALTAGLQKVSAQLDVGKSASQTVLNNQ